MPAISNLKSFGRSQSGSIGEGPCAVTRDELNTGMRFEPGRKGTRRGVWQDIHWGMPLE